MNAYAKAVYPAITGIIGTLSLYAATGAWNREETVAAVTTLVLATLAYAVKNEVAV